MTLTLAPELASIVRPGSIWWTGATVVSHEHRLDPLLAEAEAKVRITPPAESVAVRSMYKRVGIDPTKTRPSNEALLRRVRKGDTLPRINSAVDVVNWCSLEFQLPYGLYDASKISGDVTMHNTRTSLERRLAYSIARIVPRWTSAIGTTTTSATLVRSFVVNPLVLSLAETCS